jgi:hypothetical protein
VHRRLNMDRTDWPWSWEEEVEWKADLEERDYDFLQQVIDNAVEDNATDSCDILGSLSEKPSENATSEEYLVTA